MFCCSHSLILTMIIVSTVHRCCFYLDYLQRCVTTSEKISTVFEEEKKAHHTRDPNKTMHTFVCIGEGKNDKLKGFFSPFYVDCIPVSLALLARATCAPCDMENKMEIKRHRFFSQERESKSSCLFTEDSFFSRHSLIAPFFLFESEFKY